MRRRFPVAVALALGLIAAPAAATATPPHAPPLDTDLLEQKLEAFADVADHSVIAEVRSGDERWDEDLGYRSIDGTGGRVDEDDRFRIASLTKTMVATVLLQLEGEGALDLDDTLGEHLPGLLPYEAEPTVRQLMQHTGGLFDYFYYLYEPYLVEGDIAGFAANYRNHYRPEELVAIGTQDPLLFEPGAQWSYSNTGYIALGMLIEELTGNRLGHEIEERIVEPVDLDDTYFPRPYSHGLRGPHPDAYVTTGVAEEPYFDSSKLSNSQMWAAGGAVSTVGDVNDFYDAYLDGTLLSGEQLDEAMAFIDTPLGTGYGLGLERLPLVCPDDPERIYVGHTGGGLGHQTYSFHSPDGERQLTVTWNIDDRHGYADPEAFNHAFSAVLVAGLCGVDMDEVSAVSAQDLPDFAAAADMTMLG
ncbi:MAG TPA: serine hydrolase domain-containing protein [Glycomyces sp.]|nr:serine hydrolase domain-containing protein [Glycomyces sp.]